MKHIRQVRYTIHSFLPEIQENVEQLDQRGNYNTNDQRRIPSPSFIICDQWYAVIQSL